MAASESVLETQLVPGAPARRRRELGLVDVYALLAIGSFLVARFVPVLEIFESPCPFLTLTGLPCATCGMTHAFVLLAHGDAAGALAWSPAGAALAAVGWGAGVADLVRWAAGWRVPEVPERLLRGAAIAGLVALALNWAWLMFRGYGP